ncbi:MAG: type IVB secretion system protein IcmH/DotU, partial [Coxiellaceae bacterium]|nr:type IVB secretion system protein IcmH/DotU [Coxiellaceae bacterium]
KRSQQLDQDWQMPSLLQGFHGDLSGGEQFYRLLERSQANPTAFIDLLELFYLCLALGYQGKYGKDEQGYIIRENIINKLYHSIRQERGDFSKNILVGADNAKATVTPVRKTYKGVIIISLAAIATVAALVLHQYQQLQAQDQSIQQVMMKLLQPQP